MHPVKPASPETVYELYSLNTVDFPKQPRNIADLQVSSNVWHSFGKYDYQLELLCMASKI